MAGDVVWLDVLPALSGFANQLASGTTKAGTEAGKASGSAWSRAFGASAGDGGTTAATDKLIENEKRAKKAVDDATVAIGTARAAQREASARTILAEQKLTDAVAKYGEDSAQAQAASLRLESARDKQAMAADKVERAEIAIKAAAREAAEATQQLAKATDEAGDEAQDTTGFWGTLGSTLGDVKGKAQDAAGSLGGVVTAVAGAAGGAALFSAAWGDSMDLSTSTARVTAALDLTAEESERAGDVAGSLYSQAYGESMADVSGAVESVMSSIGGMREASSADLEAITGQAMSLADAMGLDVSEAATTAGQLINDGLAGDATEAFDLITASLQKVPEAMRGDVLDAANEYGTYFQTLGLDGSQAMAMLASASDGGVIGIDKMGDALKEFTIRATDMSKGTMGAYYTLGLNASDMTNALLAGGDEAEAAMDKIVTALQGVEDPGLQASTAIALFGTPLEDLNVSEIPSFLDSLGAMGTGLGDVSGSAADLDETMAGTVDPLEQIKRSFMGVLTEGLEPLLEPVQKFADWATENPGLMTGVAVALGVLAVAWGVFTVAQWAANAAMFASPLTWIIAAILAVGIAIGALVIYWDEVVAWLKDVFDPIGEWFAGIWSGMTDWVADVWQKMQDGLKAGWDWIKEKVFDPIKRGAGWIADKFVDVKDGIVGAWGNVKDGLKAGWDWIKENVVDRFVNGWNNLRDGFVLVKDKIGEVWGNVKTTLKAGWDWIGEKVFDPFKRGIKAIGTVFGDTKDIIKIAWDKIKAVAAKPVNFIIETVYTKGIKNAWDTIASKVGLDLKLPSISPIKFASGGVLPGYTPGRDVHRFHSDTGGILDLSGGEAIMRPEFTTAVGGLAGVQRLNALARTGHLNAQAFAEGGVWGWIKDKASGVGNWVADAAGNAWDWTKDAAVAVANFVKDPIGAIAELIGKPVRKLLEGVAPGIVGQIGAQLPGKTIGSLAEWAKEALTGRENDGHSAIGGNDGAGIGYRAMVDILKKQFPDIAITSTYRPGAITATGYPSMHGAGRAVDMTPSMTIFNWIKKNFPSSREIIYSPAGAQQVYNGRNYYYGEPTRSMHYNHVHWGMHQGGVLPDDLNFGTYDTGGVLPPGDTLVSNKTGLPELILTAEQVASLGTPNGPLELGDDTVDRLAERIADELGIVGETVRDVKQAVRQARTLERMGG